MADPLPIPSLWTQTQVGRDLTAATYPPGGTLLFPAGAGTGGGSVTSVALALPASVFSVSGSPVTTAGTLTGAFLTQSANTVLAGPTTGAAATPAFRALVAADIPGLTPNAITALTGDATASGPGSAALTFATVNANVGSFTNANITVNAKGLITAAASGSGGTTYTADGATLQLVGTTFSEKDGGTTNAKLANMAARTVKTNLTSGAAAPTDATFNAYIAAMLGNGTAGQAIVGDGAGNFALGTVGGGSGGALTYITSAVVSGSAVTSVTVSGLDLNTDKCYLIILGVLNKTGTGTSVSMYMNADTTAANYRRIGVTLGPSTTTASQSSASDIITMQAFIGAWTTGLVLLQLDPTGNFPVWQSFTVPSSGIGTPAPNRVNLFGVNWITSGTNVTSLTFPGSAGQIDVGTYFQVFRVRQ